ncbi:MAG: carbamoyltransferase HypF [Lewinellaceae bacterium]|nr:carbamoyltransferase HypF [Lewinellaceae bacterium]
MSQPTNHTYHLHLSGQVQGVGFRPFVWRLAQDLGLNGWVNNTTDGVHILFNADDAGATAFEKKLLEQAPGLSVITSHSLQKVEKQDFSDFQIIHSASDATPDLLLTPDFGLCADCRTELHDPANRRFGYPFITCTNCGPRFSIATGLPYDRERTTMQPFTQCPDCQVEYDNPANRRYFSQTNSCPTCGIQLKLINSTGNRQADPLDTALDWLRSGKILAAKGIGGYLLLCDATNVQALETLRNRKHRPDKPFALLYADSDQLEGDALLQPDEKTAAKPASANRVTTLRETPASGLCATLVAPGLTQIGVMLPYAPLIELLARGAGRPLVATSGNISGSPIIFEDEKAQKELLGIADGVLAHNRAIAIPQDDSVLRFSPAHRRQAIILRRSRGYAPTFLFAKKTPQYQYPNIPISQSKLALGATMKSAFAWQHRGNLYLSQYLGELGSFDTQQAFEYCLDHFQGLLREKPAQLIVDKHPDYFSTQLGKRLGHEWGIPVLEVQHHEAHFAAVLAENGYFKTGKKLEKQVLGVIWDGTGYGNDGQVWGGEFFRFDGTDIARAAHFEPFDFLLGDKMPREPRISALSLARLAGILSAQLTAQFSPQEWDLYQKMLSRSGLLHTTSVGRLFDGVVALLGLLSVSTYEGQAAMLLEQAAMRFFQKNGLHSATAYTLETPHPTLAPTGALVQHVVDDWNSNADTERGLPVFTER